MLHVTESNPHTRQHYRTLVSSDLSLCSKVVVSLYTRSTINFWTLKRERKKNKSVRKDKNYIVMKNLFLIFAIKKINYLLYIKYDFHYKMQLFTYTHIQKNDYCAHIHKLNYCSSFCIFYYM